MNVSLLVCLSFNHTQTEQGINAILYTYIDENAESDIGDYLVFILGKLLNKFDII